MCAIQLIFNELRKNKTNSIAVRIFIVFNQVRDLLNVEK